MLIQLDDTEIKKAIAMYVKKTYNMDINDQEVRLHYDQISEFIQANIVKEHK
jgi:hypothetical protein